MRFLLLCLILSALPNVYAAGPGKGSMTKQNLNVGGCEATSAKVHWNLDSLLGEPIIRAKYIWYGSSDCVLSADTVLWLEIFDSSTNGKGYIRFAPSTPSSGNYSIDMAFSPDWDEIICATSGTEKASCYSEEDAKTVYKDGRIVDFFFQPGSDSNDTSDPIPGSNQTQPSTEPVPEYPFGPGYEFRAFTADGDLIDYLKFYWDDDVLNSDLTTRIFGDGIRIDNRGYASGRLGVSIDCQGFINLKSQVNYVLGPQSTSDLILFEATDKLASYLSTKSSDFSFGSRPGPSCTIIFGDSSSTGASRKLKIFGSYSGSISDGVDPGDGDEPGDGNMPGDGDVPGDGDISSECINTSGVVPAYDIMDEKFVGHDDKEPGYVLNAQAYVYIEKTVPYPLIQNHDVCPYAPPFGGNPTRIDLETIDTHSYSARYRWTAYYASGSESRKMVNLRFQDTTPPKGLYSTMKWEPPVFPATGDYTPLSKYIPTTGAANDRYWFAYDLGGKLGVSIEEEQLLPIGSHVVNVVARDDAGNKLIQPVTVIIAPTFAIAPKAKVLPGQSYQFKVALSGEHFSYPDVLNYFVPNEGWSNQPIEFAEGPVSFLNFTVPNDLIAGDTLQLALGNFQHIRPTTGVVVGEPTVVYKDILFEVADAVDSITGEILVYQESTAVSIVNNMLDSAEIELKVVNQADINYEIDWYVNGSKVSTSTEPRLLVQTSLFEKVNFLEVKLRDGDEEILKISRVLLSDAFSSQESEDDNASEDNSTVLISDSDYDHVIDFYDTDRTRARLFLDEDYLFANVHPYHNLSLGNISYLKLSDLVEPLRADFTPIVGYEDVEGFIKLINEEQRANDRHYPLVSPLYDVTVSGLLEHGNSAAIKFDLPFDIEVQGSDLVRVFTYTNGWSDFVVDKNNKIFAASRNLEGRCPEIWDVGVPSFLGGTAYREGLESLFMGVNAPTRCLRVEVEDGGPNDADGLKNGVVQFTSGITQEFQNQAPEIELISVVNTDELETFKIDALATDYENDPLSYRWTQTSGLPVDIVDPTSTSLIFNAPEVYNEYKSLYFDLTVSDGFEETTSSIRVNVQNKNVPPEVNINSSSSVNEGEEVVIEATVTDADNDEVTYSWAQSAGPLVNLSTSNQASINFTAPEVSSDIDLTFSLSVSDGTDTITETITLTVINVEQTNNNNGNPTAEQPEGGSSGGSLDYAIFVMFMVYSILRRVLLTNQRLVYQLCPKRRKTGCRWLS